MRGRGGQARGQKSNQLGGILAAPARQPKAPETPLPSSARTAPSSATSLTAKKASSSPTSTPPPPPASSPPAAGARSETRVFSFQPRILSDTETLKPEHSSPRPPRNTASTSAPLTSITTTNLPKIFSPWSPGFRGPPRPLS